MRSLEHEKGLATMTEIATAPQGYDYAELIARIRAGDNDAMDELYQTLQRGVRWMVRRSIGPQDTDDVVNDVFYTAFRMIQRGAVQEPEHLIAYVRGIARHHILACIHSRVVAREHEADLETAGEQPDGLPSPEEVVRAKEFAGLAREAMAKLPPRRREVLARFYLQNQSAEEIRRELNLTATQFRLLKNRAKNEFGKLARRIAAGKPLGQAVLRASSLQPELQTCSGNIS